MKKLTLSLALLSVCASFAVFADTTTSAPPSTTTTTTTTTITAPTGPAVAPAAIPPSTTTAPAPSTTKQSVKPAPKQHKHTTSYGESTSIYDSIVAGWNNLIDSLTSATTQSK